MGKVVKFCTSCDESFAEKFSFCPTCGTSLQAFELNPVAAAEREAEPLLEAAPPAEHDVPVLKETISEPTEDPEAVLELEAAHPAEPSAEETIEALAAEPTREVVAEPVAESERSVPPAPVFIRQSAVDADAVRPAANSVAVPLADDGFHVTVIEEKNNGVRNSLLLGAFVFMVSVMVLGLVINIFSMDVSVGAIDDGIYTAMLLDDPTTILEEKEQPKDGNKGGGGGGGGKNEPDPASQGARPPMLREPQFVPSAHMERLTNPDIPIQMAIKGPVNETSKDPDQRYGVDTTKYGAISDGPGSGGGIGTGRGTGVGSGSGSGAGSGSGSGLGNGRGDGIGDGDGPGTGSSGPPPAARTGVTQALRIISKPKATYTDAARQNQIQGNVTLKITFNANGSIGSITPVSGLGYGLTEQAIAAARRIVFEPAKINGVPQTVSKTFQYSFTIY